MFKELDNKKIGQAIAKFRNHREVKAAEVAGHLNISEQAYTKYERGETPIHINFLNAVGNFFDVNPLHFLQNGPENVVENIHNSTVVLQNDISSSYYNSDKVIDLLKAQLEEKDKQLIQQLNIIASFGR